MNTQTTANFEFHIVEGIAARYDVAKAPLTLGTIHNKGTLELYSSSPDVDSAEITLDALHNRGSIISQLRELKIRAQTIDSTGGKISSAEHLEIVSDGDVTISGGVLESKTIVFNSGGKVTVAVEQITGEVAIEAKGVVVDVRKGDLVITHQKLSGDPVYTNGSGGITLGAIVTMGDNLEAYAVGDISVASIDTSGGTPGVSTGQIKLIAGCNSVTPSPLSWETPDVPAGSVSIGGTVTGQSCVIWGGTVSITGAVSLSEVYYPTGAGGLSIGAATTVSIDDDVSAYNSNTGLPVGSSIVVYNEADVTLSGNLIGAFSLLAKQGGEVTMGNVTGSVTITDDAVIVPECGGGGTLRSLTGTPLNVTVGNVTDFGRVDIGVSGNISIGNIEITDEHPDTAKLVMLYANVGNDSANVFNVGSGGSNGCGTITIHGRGQYGGILLIGNGNGINVGAGSISALATTYGAPDIFLSSGNGAVTLNGNLVADGDGTARAGTIIVTGESCVVSAATTISATDTTSGSSQPSPSVAVAVNTLHVNANLILTCSTDAYSQIAIGPKGSNDVSKFGACGFAYVDGGINIEGTGNLTVSAEGQYANIHGYGTPFNLNAGDVTMSSHGDSSMIDISYDGNPTGTASFISQGGKLTLDADNPDGTAGSITVNADALDITSDYSFQANALDNNGDGGSISIINQEEWDLSAETTTRISAQGFDEGAGGNISISNVSELTVCKILNVNPGDNANSATCFAGCVKGGTLSLNGVTLRQWLTGSATFPKDYYSSINLNVEGPESAIATAAALLHTTMKTQLQNFNVQIFAMESISEFNTFFKRSAPPLAGISLEDRFVSVAFRTVFSTGDFAPYMTGTIIHELGHQLDNHAWNNDAFTNTAWTNTSGTGSRNLDETAFNAASCATIVDADRLANSLPTVCALSGTNVQKLGTVLDMASDEQWARAFAEAVRAANPAQVSIYPYHVAVQSHFTNENTYMNNVVANGQP